jgi:hypothetical protein
VPVPEGVRGQEEVQVRGQEGEVEKVWVQEQVPVSEPKKLVRLLPESLVMVIVLLSGCSQIEQNCLPETVQVRAQAVAQEQELVLALEQVPVVEQVSEQVLEQELAMVQVWVHIRYKV